MSSTITYKGNTIATASNNTKTLKTQGKYLEDDITITDVSASTPTLQTKTATPTKSTQTISPDNGYDGLSSVTVNPIPNAYIQPTGTVPITENGTVDVTEYASASVNVPTGSTINNQNKTVTPTESSQEVTADSGYTGLGTVTVSAISSTYVGSGITQRDDTDLTASGATVTVPAGYYADTETKSVSTTTHPKPTATVNSSTGLVTASHTQTAGYVSAGTTTETLQLTTQAAATITPTKSSQTAVAAGKYTTGAVTVAAIPSEYIVPSGSTTITDNGTTDVTSLASVTVAVPFVTYYTGSGTPPASLGSNGDIYLKVVT